MKKVIVLSVFASLVSVVSAQTTRYNVNVYTNPTKTVEYTPAGSSSTYRQYLDGLQRSHEQNQKYMLEREKMEQAERMEMARMAAAANAEGMKVVSDEVQTFNGTNLATKVVYPIKARVIRRNNGHVDISCMGIKMGETWKSCEKPISSLQKMYQTATSEEEKSLVLELLDLGNYLLDTGTEIYIIK